MAWENLPSTNTPLNATNLDKITDSGSNSNGHWLKLQDGTLIQWNYMAVLDQAINNDYGSLYQGERTVVFPIAYLTTPTVVCSQFRWGNGASWGTVNSVAVNSAILRGIDITSRGAGTTVIISWMAIGRWK